MATQTYGGAQALTNAQRNYYAMMLLDRAYPYMPMFGSFGGPVKTTIPENMGITAEWRAYGGPTAGAIGPQQTGVGLTLATSVLSEGVAPAETPIGVEKITATIAQYGAWVKLSDLLVHQGIDPIWAEAYELLGEQAGQTLHTVLINVLGAGTGSQVIYQGARTTRATLVAGDVITGTDVRRTVRVLARNKTPRFPDGYYHGLIHPDVAYDLRNDTDWKNMNVYQGGSADAGNSMVKGQVGSLHGVLFEESTDAPTFAIGVGGATVPVFGTLIFGPRWFGTVDLAAQRAPNVNPNTGKGIQVTGVPVETPTKSDDPLGQYGVAGWKCAFAAVRLSPWKAQRLETAASA